MDIVPERVDVKHRCGHVETYEPGKEVDAWILCRKCHATWAEGRIKTKPVVKDGKDSSSGGVCCKCKRILAQHEPHLLHQDGRGVECLSCYGSECKDLTDQPEFTAPPLGIRGRKFWLEDRAKELCGAIERRLEAGMVPLECWSTELTIILSELRETSKL